MSEPTTRAELLAAMQAGYEKFNALLAPLNEAQLTEPGASDDWSIKDILVHLATWQGRAAQALEAAKRGEQPQFDTPINTPEEMNRFNDATFAANRARSLAEVEQDFRTSYQRLFASVEALGEADLFEPGHFAWMEGDALWKKAEGDTFGHYDEHAPPIEAWLARRNA